MRHFMVLVFFLSFFSQKNGASQIMDNFRVTLEGSAGMSNTRLNPDYEDIRSFKALHENQNIVNFLNGLPEISFKDFEKTYDIQKWISNPHFQGALGIDIYELVFVKAKLGLSRLNPSDVMRGFEVGLQFREVWIGGSQWRARGAVSYEKTKDYGIEDQTLVGEMIGRDTLQSVFFKFHGTDHPPFGEADNSAINFSAQLERPIRGGWHFFGGTDLSIDVTNKEKRFGGAKQTYLYFFAGVRRQLFGAEYSENPRYSGGGYQPYR